jgi:hypothetical protein
MCCAVLCCCCSREQEQATHLSTLEHRLTQLTTELSRAQTQVTALTTRSELYEAVCGQKRALDAALEESRLREARHLAHIKVLPASVWKFCFDIFAFY